MLLYLIKILIFVPFFVIAQHPAEKASPLEDESAPAENVSPIEDESENLDQDVSLMHQEGNTPEQENGPDAEESKKSSLTLMEAVTLTLQNQLDIKIAIEQIQFQDGVWQESAGPFDPTLGLDETYTKIINAQNVFIPIKTHFVGDQVDFIASIRKKTRIGTRYSFDLELSKVKNPALYPYEEVQFTTVAFSIEQPLLKGFKYGLDAMTEKSNEFLVTATYFDSLQEISQRILNTTLAYWDMVAAKKARDTLQEAVKRFTELTNYIQKLSEEDLMAKTDIVQPLARLLKRKVDLQAAEQDYYRSFENLKFAMNVIEEIPCAKETTFNVDDVKIGEFPFEQFNQLQCALLERAAKQRYDIIALETRDQALGFLIKGAKNGLLPSLNVIANVTQRDFHGFRPNFCIPHRQDKGPPEIDVTVGINVAFPFYNDAAKGLLRQFIAQQAQVRIRTEQLVQQSLKDLRTALSNQVSLAKNVVMVTKTVEEDARLVSNETKKFEAGYAGFNTLVFLTDFENTLTDNTLRKIFIERDYLQNIALIRFLSATLFNPEETFDIIDFNNLCSLKF